MFTGKGLAVAVMAAAVATPAAAVGIVIDSYSVSSNTANFLGDGLVINTSNEMVQPFDVGNLEEGESVSFDLFSIYTNESNVGLDDLIPGDIEFMLELSAPNPNSGMAGLNGMTFGLAGLFTGSGVLTWENSGIFQIFYGVNNDGIITVDLNDATFNECSGFSCGIGGLNAGAAFGDIVDITFTLTQAASVPAPAALGLLGFGLFGIAAARRRRA